MKIDANRELTIGDVVWIPKLKAQGTIIQIEVPDDKQEAKFFIVRRFFLDNKNMTHEVHEKFIPYEVEPYAFHLARTSGIVLQEPNEKSKIPVVAKTEEPAPVTAIDPEPDALPAIGPLPKSGNKPLPEPETPPRSIFDFGGRSLSSPSAPTIVKKDMVNQNPPPPENYRQQPSTPPPPPKPDRVGYDALIEDGAIIEIGYGPSRIRIQPKAIRTPPTFAQKPAEPEVPMPPKPEFRVGQIVVASDKKLYKVAAIFNKDGKVYYQCVPVRPSYITFSENTLKETF